MSRSRNKPAANPFIGLIAPTVPVPPITGACTVVVAGQKVTDVRQIDTLLVDPDRSDDLAIAEARRLAEAARKAKRRAADLRYRSKPEAQAKRKAWMEAHPGYMQAYREKYRSKVGPKKIAAASAAAFQRRWHSDIEASREKARAYYHANKDRIREQKARLRASAAADRGAES